VVCTGRAVRPGVVFGSPRSTRFCEDPLVSEDHFRRLERPAVVEFRYRVIPIPRIGASEGKRAKADASWFQRPPITVDTGAADREIRPHGPFGRMSLR
jgi:hypothetical protein